MNADKKYSQVNARFSDSLLRKVDRLARQISKEKDVYVTRSYVIREAVKEYVKKWLK